MVERETNPNPYKNMTPLELKREFELMIDFIPHYSLNPVDDPKIFPVESYQSEIDAYKVSEQKVRQLLDLAPITQTYREYLVFQYKQAYKWGNVPQERDSFSLRVIGEDEEDIGIYNQEHARYVETQDFMMGVRVSRLHSPHAEGESTEKSKKYFSKWREEFIDKYQEDPFAGI